jgi:hypothetical protein
LDCNQKIGGNWSLELVGDHACKIGGNHAEQCGGIYSVAAGCVVIEAKDITLKAGGNFIRIDGAGITILGTQVDINSGGVAGNCTPLSVAAPGAPVDACSITPGADTRYGGNGHDPADSQDDDGACHDGDDLEKTPSWIEIEMVDEKGQPWANEEYEIVAPNGKTVHEGTLDEKGQAHVALAEPGMCQVQFPRLDAAAWEKIA